MSRFNQYDGRGDIGRWLASSHIKRIKSKTMRNISPEDAKTEAERVQELREKFPEGQRSALMDDFLDGVALSAEDKVLLKKLKKLGVVEGKE